MRVDGNPARPSLKVLAGQQVVVDLPPPPVVGIIPQPMALDVVYEDDDLVVVEKAAGIVVHPGAGHPDGTLVNGLMHRYGTLSPLGAPDRPGIVHRIDAGTSGLLVCARTEAAHNGLAAQFAAHSTERRYLALVWGHKIEDAGTIETMYCRHPRDRRRFTGKFGGTRRAVTHWEVLERRPPCAWVTCRLETGRTHQIRVHLAESGHPLVGDTLYGGRRRVDRPQSLRRLGIELGLGRQALHAATLGFVHPRTGEALRFESAVPADVRAILDALEAA